MTIQSSSPRTSRVSRCGSTRRRAPISASARPLELRRVLGRGGSSSRISRSTSANAASRMRSRWSGVVPVSSS